MRKQETKRKELKIEAKKMFCNGIYQKEISKELGVTEKTVSEWLRPLKESLKTKEEILTKLFSRLNEALDDAKTSQKDIFCLCQSIYMVKNSTDLVKE